MKIGFIGLGRMGRNMVLNLLEHKIQVVAYDVMPKAAKGLARKGAVPASSMEELVGNLPRRKIVWLMIPAGKPVESTLEKLLPLLRRGDIVIDGGNSFYKDSIARYKKLKKRGVHFLDCGTSGGVEGARRGACMMVGGSRAVFKKVERLFRVMCVKDGYGYMGGPGAGHFVKMVHNGIEYGMMGAINEGFEAIKKHSKTFKTELGEVAKVYAHGSIIEGRLLGWLLRAFETRDYLRHISCEVPRGETEAEMEHLEKIARMDVLNAARRMRARSRKGGLCARYVAAMRNQFGGHAVKRR